MKQKFSGSMVAVVLLGMLLLITGPGCIGAAAQLMYILKGHKTPAAYDGLVNQKVAVICVSDATAYGPDTLTYTISKAVSVRLATTVKKINIVPPSKVEEWMDVNGWGEHDFVEIGKGLKVDKVLAIEVGNYSIREGQTLYKGRVDLTVSVYDINKEGMIVFALGPREYSFPKDGRPAIQTDDRKFEALYLAKLTEYITNQFYDHDALDSFAEDAQMMY